MAKNSERRSYPMLPPAHWWSLRDRFKKSIPGVITENYIASVLNMKEESARANVIPYLKAIGLADEQGKTNQEMAVVWRDDSQYRAICSQIRESIYPEDLLHAAPDPVTNRPEAERWFANNTGYGTAAVRRMAQFYILLMEADLSKRADEKSKQTPKKPIKLETKPDPKKQRSAKENSRTDGQAGSDLNSASTTAAPGIFINLQIHISADATPDQIDQIFQSMAKHIYGKK